MPAFSLQYPWKSIVWAFQKSLEIPESTSASRATARATHPGLDRTQYRRIDNPVFPDAVTPIRNIRSCSNFYCGEILPIWTPSKNFSSKYYSVQKLWRSKNSQYDHISRFRCPTTLSLSAPLFGGLLFSRTTRSTRMIEIWQESLRLVAWRRLGEKIQKCIIMHKICINMHFPKMHKNYFSERFRPFWTTLGFFNFWLEKSLRKFSPP